MEFLTIILIIFQSILSALTFLDSVLTVAGLDHKLAVKASQDKVLFELFSVGIRQQILNMESQLDI